MFTIELDTKLAAILKRTLSSFSNVTVVNEDILKVDPARLLQTETGVSSPLGYKVVANLPYYITSAVLRHFLEASLKPGLIVVMVQKEVAQAITSAPGEMSVLSVSVQFYGRPETVSYVPATAFYPPPEVDSAILKITVYPAPVVDVSSTEDFFRLVRAGFSTARKQLVNSLSKGLDLPKPEALSLLERAGISPQRRAETLTLEEWAELLRMFNKSAGNN